jgi:hypothetical protein
MKTTPPIIGAMRSACAPSDDAMCTAICVDAGEREVAQFDFNGAGYAVFSHFG